MTQIISDPVSRRSDAAGIASWAHIGDLRLITRSGQNCADLNAIIEQLNQVFVDSISFVLLLGEHDVSARGFAPYCHAICSQALYAVDVGDYSFIAVNAFSPSVPDRFVLRQEQIDFLRQNLENVQAHARYAVLFLHGYPTGLGEGCEQVRELIDIYRPLLVETGHAHCNEIARDSSTIYIPTRPAGQIEEGRIGFSITNIDRGSVSRKFKPLDDERPFVMITHPADGRLRPKGATEDLEDNLLRVKVWSQRPLAGVIARAGDNLLVPMVPVEGSNVWQAHLPRRPFSTIAVTAETIDRAFGSDEIEPLFPETVRLAARDKDDAINPSIPGLTAKL